MPSRSPAAVARALGVSRVARLTGLDRSDLEVATAVRPRGHVLQVTQGKGRTWAAALWSALGEAAELAAAERPTVTALRWARAPDLPSTLGDVPQQLVLAWVEAAWLQGGAVFLPADSVFCPPQGSLWLGPSVSEWTSNGLAAHWNRDAAVEHAVCEVVERDAVARVLPEGWTAGAAGRLLTPPAGLKRRLEAQGLEVFVFDLSPRGAQLPTAGALLFDRHSTVVPLTAGYATRRLPAAAVEAAVLEAVQSRLTEIHGAREDVEPGARVDGARLHEVLRCARARRRTAQMPSFRRALAALRTPLAVVELATEPLVVVKAVGPELLRSELLS